MKLFSIFIPAFFLLFILSCNSKKPSERTLLETDTVEVEKEYEVEKKYREVTVDTITETETVEKEVDLTKEENPSD